MHEKRKVVWIKDDQLRLRGVINANRGSGGGGGGEFVPQVIFCCIHNLGVTNTLHLGAIHRAVISLRADDNLTLISTVCEAVQRSLFRTPNGLNELPEVRFKFPFNLIGDHDKQNKGLSKWPIVTRTQIWVHSWKSRTRISALFRRRS